MPDLDETTRTSVPLVTLLSLCAGLVGAGATGTLSAVAARDRLAAELRGQQRELLRHYPTREELWIELDRRLERLERRLVEQLRREP